VTLLEFNCVLKGLSTPLKSTKKKRIELADWATIISLKPKRFGKPLRNVQCGHQFLRVCQNLSLISKRLEKSLRTGHLDFGQKQFFGVCHSLSLTTKRFEKLLRNGQTTMATILKSLSQSFP